MFVISTLTRSYPPHETSALYSLHVSVQFELEQSRQEPDAADPGRRRQFVEIVGMPDLHSHQQGVLRNRWAIVTCLA
jgi:hypothetical protein